MRRIVAISVAAIVAAMLVVACGPGRPVRVVDYEYSKSAMGTTLKSVTVQNISNNRRVRNIWVQIVDNQKKPVVHTSADGVTTVRETTQRVNLSRISLDNIVLEPGDQQTYTLPNNGITFAAVNPSFEIGTFAAEELAPQQ